MKENNAMSTKFEQLLDFLVNEEMDKANELFHEIVVEKSREIYENLIAEEVEAETDVEEATEENPDDSVEEATEEDESVEENMDLEDSYEMDEGDEGDEEPEAGGMEKTDDFHDEVTGAESDEDEAILDMKAAFDELKAALEKLEHAQGGEAHSEFDDEEMAKPEMADEEDMTMGMYEGRRVTREYVEKVGDADWAGGSQKAQGKLAGAGTGDKDGAPKEGTSPIAKLSKPSIGDTSAKNIVAKSEEGQHNTGTKPNAVNKGVAPESGEKFAKDAMANSAPGAHTKGYSNKASVAQGEGRAVGAGTGENSVKGATNTKTIVRKV
jgi:hypothetical protein